MVLKVDKLQMHKERKLVPYVIQVFVQALKASMYLKLMMLVDFMR